MRTVLVVLAAALGACERSAPEPVGAPRPVPARSPAAVADPRTTPPDRADPAERAAPPPARCLVPTPATPPRPVAPGPDPRCPPDPDRGPPMVPVGHVAFPDAPSAGADGGPVRLEVELMLTRDTQARGMMYRKSQRDDRGMLFVWPESAPRTFWMHNTCIPLDMLFLDADGFVAGIVENAPTLNDEGRGVDCPARFVLEVNAGWSRKHGVRAGHTARIEGVPSGR